MKLQDLKRGMRCTRRSGLQYLVDETEIAEGVAHYTLSSKSFGEPGGLDEDLTHPRLSSLDIVKVEDITLDGYKTIWEREEERYYLRIPNTDNQYLYYDQSKNSYYVSLSKSTEFFGMQTRFTGDEINKLPFQDFVNSLIREVEK